MKDARKLDSEIKRLGISCKDELSAEQIQLLYDFDSGLLRKFGKNAIMLSDMAKA